MCAREMAVARIRCSCPSLTIYLVHSSPFGDHCNLSIEGSPCFCGTMLLLLYSGLLCISYPAREICLMNWYFSQKLILPVASRFNVRSECFVASRTLFTVVCRRHPGTEHLQRLYIYRGSGKPSAEKMVDEKNNLPCLGSENSVHREFNEDNSLQVLLLYDTILCPTQKASLLSCCGCSCTN